MTSREMTLVNEAIAIRGRRRGFTLAELVLGMAITALVMSAVAAVMMSVAQGWDEGQNVQALSLSLLQLQVRLGRIFQGAAYVAQSQAGSLSGGGSPAQIYFWMNDNWNGSSDGVPEAGEMGLIVFDSTTHSIYLYSAIPASAMSSGQLAAAGTEVSWSASESPTAIAAFEGNSWVQKTTLAGPGSYAMTTNTIAVTGVHVAVDWLGSTSQKPTVEFQVALARGSETATMYGSFVLRLADQPPNN
jgi:prepilin-type N-terminal cleavage/methylation domain-containing protein